MVREKADTFSARTLSVLGHVKGFRPHPMAWAVMEGFKQRRTASNLTFFFFFFTSFLQLRCVPWIAEKVEQGWAEAMVPKSCNMVVVGVGRSGG